MDFEKYDLYQSRLGAIGEEFYFNSKRIASELNESERIALEKISLEMKYALDEMARIISFTLENQTK